MTNRLKVLTHQEHFRGGSSVNGNTSKKSLAPSTTADAAVYVQTGTIPVEGVIHKRTLSLFGNVTRQDKSSIKQQLASRQLTVKSLNSHS